MKATLFTLGALCILALNGCKKDCPKPTEACQDIPPTNELCQAHFKRWFYVEADNRCVEISYSGCSAKGFSSKAECENCLKSKKIFSR